MRGSSSFLFLRSLSSSSSRQQLKHVTGHLTLNEEEEEEGLDVQRIHEDPEDATIIRVSQALEEIQVNDQGGGEGGGGGGEANARDFC